jgi:DNA-binding MltR family transcriptional regulator
MPPRVKAVIRLVEHFMHHAMAYYAIVAGEELNQRLETLLKAFLVDDHTRLREMFGEGGSLGTFSSRIEMAAALGLISNTERHDLNLIRQIRNDMAHDSFFRPGKPELLFEDDKTKSRCAQLRTPSQFDDKLFEPFLSFDSFTPDEATETLTLFLKACFGLVAALIVRTRNTVRCQKPGLVTDDEFRTAISEFHNETKDPELEGMDELSRKVKEITKNLVEQQRKKALPE